MGFTMFIKYEKFIKNCFDPMKMAKKTTEVSIFAESFSRFGYPSHLIMNKNFTKASFKKWMKAGGIRHSAMPPNFSAINGPAKNFVGAFKRKATSVLKDRFTLKVVFIKFVFDYRRTTHAATNKSPASLMFGRQLKTLLFILASSSSRK